MTPTISFNGITTVSRLRNGYVKTTAVDLMDLTQRSDTDVGVVQRVLQIQPITSRNSLATGYIELPFNEEVLRALAVELIAKADSLAEGSMKIQIEAMRAVIDHEMEAQSMAHEDMIDLLDEMVHHTHGDDTAAFINNQGIDDQLEALISNGCRTALMRRLCVLGIHDLKRLNDIHDQMIFELTNQGETEVAS